MADTSTTDNSKADLQTALKNRYGINKNISQVLTQSECQHLLTLLDSDSKAVKLIESLVDKNSDLGNRNRQFGREREQAKQRLAQAKAEYDTLQAEIAQIEDSNQTLGQRKRQLEQETTTLQAQVDRLTARSQQLEGQVKTLNSENRELVNVNDELKQDNRRLKNLLDAIRLKFSQEMRQVLKTEDSEIRKAIVKLYKSILG
jgi:uncharacterized protein (DUF3084 family)